MVFIKDFFYSMFNMKHFKQLKNRSVQYSTFYFIFLMLLFSFSIFINVYHAVWNEYNSIKREFNSEIKNFEIKDGILSIKGKEPLIIKRSDFAIIFNDENKKLKGSINNYGLSIYFLRDGIKFEGFEEMDVFRPLMRNNGGFNIENGLKYNQLARNLTQKGFLDLMDIYIIIITLTMGIVNSLANIINLLILTLIITSIAVVVNHFNGLRTPFKYVYKIGIYALTLPIVLRCGVFLLNINSQFIDLIFIMLGLIYLLFAFNALVSNDNQNLNSQTR